MKNIQTFEQYINESIENDKLYENFSFDKFDDSIINVVINSLEEDLITRFYGNKTYNRLKKSTHKPFNISNGDLYSSIYYDDFIIKDVIQYKYNYFIKSVKDFFKNNLKTATDQFIKKRYNKINSVVFYSTYDDTTNFSLLKTLGVKSGVKLNELEMPPFYFEYNNLTDYETGGAVVSNPYGLYSFDELVHGIKKYYKIK